MRKIGLIFFIAFFPLLSPLLAQDSFNRQCEAFFSTYVVKGSVLYGDLSKEKTALTEVLALQKQVRFSQLNQAQKKAFYINTYNLSVIAQVVEHYPLSSVLKVQGFFDHEFIAFSGREGLFSLNQIENDMLRKEFSDPRLHFALVCGAVDCPKIPAYAFRPEKLEQQLEERTSKAIQDTHFIRINAAEEKIQVSSIFEWYIEDFGGNIEGVRDFIRKYWKGTFPSTYKLNFYQYDWSLNEGQAEIVDDAPLSNVQRYTPSALLSKGQFEIMQYYSIYTQTAFRNDERQKVDLNRRDSYFTWNLNFLTGLDQKGKINAGMEVFTKGVRLDQTKGSTPVFNPRIQRNDSSRFRISALGPKMKMNLSKKHRITWQSMFLIPLGKNLEADQAGDAWLDYERFTWWNQFFWDKSLSFKWQLFLEADALFRIPKPKNSYFNQVPKGYVFSSPLSAFLSYIPSKKSTIYTMIQFSPGFSRNLNDFDSDGSYSDVTWGYGDYLQAGLGMKYQILPKLQAEGMYSKFLTALNGGAGESFFFSLRYIH